MAKRKTIQAMIFRKSSLSSVMALMMARDDDDDDDVDVVYKSISLDSLICLLCFVLFS